MVYIVQNKVSCSKYSHTNGWPPFLRRKVLKLLSWVKVRNLPNSCSYFSLRKQMFHFGPNFYGFIVNTRRIGYEILLEMAFVVRSPLKAPANMENFRATIRSSIDLNRSWVCSSYWFDGVSVVRMTSNFEWECKRHREFPGQLEVRTCVG